MSASGHEATIGGVISGHKRPFGGRLFERIQQPRVETAEVPHAARNNGQIVHESRCRNHGIFVDGAGLTVHELDLSDLPQQVI